MTFIVIANASTVGKAGQRAGYGESYFAVDFAVRSRRRRCRLGVKSWASPNE